MSLEYIHACFENASPLDWKIDTEHCARQHLRHRAFRHDLSFLGHRAEYIREPAFLKDGAHEAQAILPASIGQTRLSASLHLAQLLQRYGRQILPEFPTFPPRTRLAMFLHGSETVTIKTCPNVARWLIRKRIVRK